jgi:hypothetical protein
VTLAHCVAIAEDVDGKPAQHAHRLAANLWLRQHGLERCRRSSPIESVPAQRPVATRELPLGWTTGGLYTYSYPTPDRQRLIVRTRAWKLRLNKTRRETRPDVE